MWETMLHEWEDTKINLNLSTSHDINNIFKIIPQKQYNLTTNMFLHLQPHKVPSLFKCAYVYLLECKITLKSIFVSEDHLSPHRSQEDLSLHSKHCFLSMDHIHCTVIVLHTFRFLIIVKYQGHLHFPIIRHYHRLVQHIHPQAHQIVEV